MLPNREVTVLFDRCGQVDEPFPSDLARQVGAALKVCGHAVRFLAVEQPDLLDALKRSTGSIFNLVDTFEGSGTGVAILTALLETLRLPYTGSDSHGIQRSVDKAFTKHLLATADIPFPAFRLVQRGSRRPKSAADLLPAIVKPRLSDGSYGIDQDAVVTNVAQMDQRVEFVHR